MDADPDRPISSPRPRRRWPLVAAMLAAAVMAALLVALIALAQGGGPALNADPVLVDRDGRQAGSYAAGLPIDVSDLAADIRTLTG